MRTVAINMLKRIKVSCYVTTCLLCVAMTHGVSATENTVSPVLAEQRLQFAELEKQLGRATPKMANSLQPAVSALSDYPLYPYLVRQQIDATMDMAHRDQIESFLLTYHNQPFTYGLRGRWLRYLAKHGEKKAFLANYRDGMGATITCQYLQYQLEDASQPNYWLGKVEALWLSGYSQPDECDPVFKQWKDAGMMTDAHVLGRIEKAALSGNPKLVPYLKMKLPPSQQYLADLWYEVRRNPELVLAHGKFPLKHPESEMKIVTYGLEKLAWKEAERAIKAHRYWQPKKLFSTSQVLAINRAIALSLAIDDKPQSEVWLQRADVTGAKADVKHWHVAYLLRHKKWQAVLALIEQAPGAVKTQESYRYWQARSLEALGQTDEALSLYETLANERHYYGFMASAKVNRQPALQHQPAPRDDANITMIAQRPAARRAKEFLALGRLIDARREWRFLVNSLDSSQVKDAALLASDWGWFDQAIITFTQSGFMDDVEKRFPLAYTEQFSAVGQAYDVHPAFAMAIARRESSFMVDAVSPAGARGLMQLMPGTARYISEGRVATDDLFDATHNVKFGVQYLRYLMDKMGDNPVLVSASYNAGWQRVMKWLPADKNVETDIWIETIPYKETRNYVKAVMAYRYIYEQQLGSSSELFLQLAASAIPPVTGLAVPQRAQRGVYAPK